MSTLRKVLKINFVSMIRKSGQKKAQVSLLLELVIGLFGIQVCHLKPVLLLIYPVLECQLHSSFFNSCLKN